MIKQRDAITVCSGSFEG